MSACALRKKYSYTIFARRIGILVYISEYRTSGKSYQVQSLFWAHHRGNVYKIFVDIDIFNQYMFINICDDKCSFNNAILQPTFRLTNIASGRSFDNFDH